MVSYTFYPNRPIFLHRYICHICDILQLCGEQQFIGHQCRIELGLIITSQRRVGVGEKKRHKRVMEGARQAFATTKIGGKCLSDPFQMLIRYSEKISSSDSPAQKLVRLWAAGVLLLPFLEWS